MTKLTFRPFAGKWLMHIDYAGGGWHEAMNVSLPALLDLAKQYVEEDQQHEEAK